MDLPSEGCSKPQSTMDRRSSGFKRKSRKPVEWIPTYPFFTASPDLAPAPSSAATSSSSASDGAHLPHFKNWLRTKHAVLFRLSNRTIQVCFQDGSEVLLSSEASACVFTSKGGVRGCHSLGALPQDPELLRRLRYGKEVLHQLVSRA